MRSEASEVELISRRVRDQHIEFLEYTGLVHGSSIKVKEQFEALILSVEGVRRSLELNRESAKTSSEWLSTSLSLKHNQAVRRASEESRAASVAMRENTEAMKTIAEGNRLDTVAMKENTDAMKSNGALMHEIAEQTLKTHEDMKKNSETMRLIAEESKKITEANSKETELMTQMAVDTQRDAQSMKVLAVLTMIYLPPSFISGIFGWSIISFEVGEDGSQHLVLSKKWWLFVAVALPLTLVTMAGCFVWIWTSRKQITMLTAEEKRTKEEEKKKKKTTP